ncbi:GH15676 [Drosophila grimshawi]|uniref:GH15676 n=1 Tax=Drosophila grimshawi TaxID=7222 RepID=B4JUJ2_DROGR|nr:GH15676 [Drosophila grimshawi]
MSLNDSFNKYEMGETREVLQRQRLIANAIKSDVNWTHIANVGGGCPIVTVVYKPEGRQCDISFSCGLTYSQNMLVKHLFDMQPIARYMVIFLRGWIKDIQLHSEFRNHILILMVIFFLQHEHYLPGIDKLQANQSASIGGMCILRKTNQIGY